MLENSAFRSAFEAADDLVRQLSASAVKIVFAESCTAGLASALLAQIPGVSAWHCGSAVTYREATKTGWLGVSAEDIAKYTAVSEQIAGQMATGVLRKTPEANLALSITGHLGPDAPRDFDGLAFVGVAQRTQDDSVTRIKRVACHRLQLRKPDRHGRAWEAATAVLNFARQSLLSERG